MGAAAGCGRRGARFPRHRSLRRSTAYALSIGPGDRSRIYKTTDGGKSWVLQFTNPDPKAFYDAIAFWDAANGIAVGDPVDGRFTIVRTSDGGATWTRLDPAGMPPAIEGDGAFAASGTILVASGRGDAWFGSGGGAKARVFHSRDRGTTWQVADTPLAAGTASAGVFSIAFFQGTRGIAVGGDYRKEREPADNVVLTADGGVTWALPGTTRLRSFRSAVAYVPGGGGRVIVAVGRPGRISPATAAAPGRRSATRASTRSASSPPAAWRGRWASGDGSRSCNGRGDGRRASCRAAGACARPRREYERDNASKKR